MAEKYTGQKGTKYGFVYQSKQYEGLTVNVTELTSSFQDLKGGLEMMYALTNASKYLSSGSGLDDSFTRCYIFALADRQIGKLYIFRLLIE